MRQPPIKCGDDAARVVCNRKHRYATKMEARDGARRSIAQHGGTTKLYEYPCDHCTGWHLTKMNPAEYRRRKRDG